MRPLALLLAAGTIFTAASALAATVHFTAKLDGASETPPNDSKATGNAVASLDTTTKQLTWTVTYAGLSGPATMAHFHGPAPVGKAAGVAVPIVPDAPSPAKGSATLTDGQIGDLRGGLWYVNVHTALHPGGEIRGQLKQGH